MKSKDLEACGESILIISQVTGEWTVRSLELAKYHKCLIYFKDMSRFIYLACPVTDALTTLVSMLKITDYTPLKPH